VEELTEDEKFGAVHDPAYPHIKGFSGTMGEHLRRRIAASKKQIQYGAKQGIPSVLLIYSNLDRVFQMFGTDDMDVTAAMYGQYTILIDKNSRQASEMFNGNNQSGRCEYRHRHALRRGRLDESNGESPLCLGRIPAAVPG
jgi:hypothetical protein